MAKTETKLVILGIVAVLSIVILVFLFKIVMSGATVNKAPYYPFPNTPYGNPNANPFPYQAGSMDMPSQTYGVLTGDCEILATPQIHAVAPEYIIDADYQQMLAYTGRVSKCIFSDRAQKGYCCTMP